MSENFRDSTTLLRARLRLAFEQPPKQLDGELLLREPADLFEELRRQHVEIRLLEAGGREYVDHLVRRYGPRDDLPNRVFQLLVGLGVDARGLHDGRSNGLEESHVVTNRDGGGVRHSQSECLRELADCLLEALLAVFEAEHVVI